MRTLGSFFALHRSLWLLSTAVMVTACGRDIPNFSGSSGGSGSDALAIVPAERQLFVGQNFTFDIIKDGASVIGAPGLEVTPEDTSILTVAPDGTGVAIAAGTTSFSAELEGDVAVARVEVVEGELTSLTVSPDPVLLNVGGFETLRVTGTLSTGATIDLSGASSGTTYTTNDPAVATVNAAGQVEAIGAGATFLRVENGLRLDIGVVVSGTGELQSIRIEPELIAVRHNESTQLSVIGTLSDGSQVDVLAGGYAVSFDVVDARLARIDAGGLLTANTANGVTQVTAQVEGLVAAATLQVRPPDSQLIACDVTPEFSNLTVGDSFRLTVIGIYSDGSTADLTPGSTGTTYRSVPASVAGVDANGLVTGLGVGEATVVVSVPSQPDKSVFVRVTDQIQLTGLEIAPGRIRVLEGEVGFFRVFARFSDGSSLDVTGSPETQLALNNPNAQLLGPGQLLGVSQGRSRLTATYRGLAARAQVLIDPGMNQVIGIFIAPPFLEMGVTEVVSFSVLAEFADGSIQDVTFDPNVVAQIFDPNIAQLVTTNQIVGISNGRTELAVDYLGFGAFAEISVRPSMSPFVAIQIVAPATMVVGDSSQLFVLGIRADGSFEDLTFDPGLMLGSSPPGFLSVSPGTIDALAVGTADVIANFQGLLGTSTVNITAQPDPVVSLTWQPSSITMDVNQTQTARVIATFQSGLQLNVTYSPELSGGTSGPITIQPSVDDIIIVPLGPGNGSVDVSYRGLSASLPVTILPGMNQVVDVTLRIARTIDVNQTVPYQVIATFADGSVQDVTLDPNLIVDTVPPGPLQILGMGLAIGVSPGVVEVIATYQGIGDSVIVQVVPQQSPVVSIAFVPSTVGIAPGQSTIVQLVATRADGSTENISADPSVLLAGPPDIQLQVTPAGIQVTPLPGSMGGTINASYLMFGATLTVNIQMATVIGIRVAPTSLNLNVGGTAQLTVFAQYSDGREEIVTPSASFSSATPAIATVTGSGFVVGQAGGMTTVSIGFMGFNASVAVTVNQAVLIGIRAEPSPLTLNLGDTRAITIIGLFDDGSESPIAGGSYSSTNPTVATVDGAGIITAQGAGVAQIIVSSQGFTSSINVNVTGAQLVDLRVEPFASTIGINDTLQLTVIGIYSDGSEAPLTTGLTFTSLDPNVASVTQTGLVSAVGQGFSLIQVDGPNGLGNIAFVTVTTQTVPTLISVTPTSILAGSPGVLITVTGTGFLPGDELVIANSVNPGPLGTLVQGPTQLQATIPGFELQDLRELELRLVRQNPPVISNALFITVGAPPNISDVAPSAIVAGGTTRVTLTGTGLSGITQVSASVNGVSGVVANGAPDGTNLGLDMTVGNNTPAGPVTVTITNAFGSDTFTVDVVVAAMDLIVLSGQTVTLSGTNVYGNVVVQTGGTIVGNGLEPLAILATGDVTIRGEIQVNGFSGELGFQNPAAGGDGGPGGGGGGGGGDGNQGFAAGGNGSPVGQAGGSPQGAGTPAGDGGGDGAGFGGAFQCGPAGGGGALGGNGGAGGGDFGNGSGGAGGTAGGQGSTFGAGTGGGGGSTCGPNSGGGGGGGGGMLLLQAPAGDILIDGLVVANGGEGGNGFSGTGGGGGGSGGRVELRAPTGTVTVNDTINASGGVGGQSDFGDTGGGGGGGIIVLEGLTIDTSLGTLNVDGGPPGFSLGGGNDGLDGAPGLVLVNP